MVMVMSGGNRYFHMATFLLAMLALCLQLQGCVTNAVLLQFFPDLLLNLVGIRIGDNVHGGVMLPVKIPPNTSNIAKEKFRMNAIKIFFSVFIMPPITEHQDAPEGF